MSKRTVTDKFELEQALCEGVDAIIVEGQIPGLTGITLPPGTALQGREEAVLEFGSKGITVTIDNSISDLTIVANPSDVAIGTDTSLLSMGRITLTNVVVCGQVALIMEDVLSEGTAIVDSLTITYADTRGRAHRPRTGELEILQGALTVWNRQRSSASKLFASLAQITVGTIDAPVRGTGILLSGGTCPRSCQVGVEKLSTNAVVVDGGIPERAGDLIAGGIVIGPGVNAGTLLSNGPILTRDHRDSAIVDLGEISHITLDAPLAASMP